MAFLRRCRLCRRLNTKNTSLHWWRRCGQFSWSRPPSVRWGLHSPFFCRRSSCVIAPPRNPRPKALRRRARAADLPVTPAASSPTTRGLDRAPQHARHRATRPILPGPRSRHRAGIPRGAVSNWIPRLCDPLDCGSQRSVIRARTGEYQKGQQLRRDAIQGNLAEVEVGQPRWWSSPWCQPRKRRAGRRPPAS
jgi:hypothetical protein